MEFADDPWLNELLYGEKTRVLDAHRVRCSSVLD
jgi:hypothetical protein